MYQFSFDTMRKLYACWLEESPTLAEYHEWVWNEVFDLFTMSIG